MNSKVTTPIVLLLFLVSSVGADTLTIDFEDAGPGEFPTLTRFGVEFTATDGGTMVSQVFGPTPNGTFGLTGSDLFSLSPLRADFFENEANFVSVDLGDFNGDDDVLYLNAFSADDVLLGSDSLNIPDTFIGMETLQVSADNISYVIYGGIDGQNFSSVFTDNFTFTRSVPEPAVSGFLFLLGIGLFARKR